MNTLAIINNYRLHESNAIQYAGAVLYYIQNKSKFVACVSYEDLTKNPEVNQYLIQFNIVDKTGKLLLFKEDITKPF